MTTRGGEGVSQLAPPAAGTGWTPPLQVSAEPSLTETLTLDIRLQTAGGRVLSPEPLGLWFFVTVGPGHGQCAASPRTGPVPAGSPAAPAWLHATGRTSRRSVSPVTAQAWAPPRRRVATARGLSGRSRPSCALSAGATPLAFLAGPAGSGRPASPALMAGDRSASPRGADAGGKCRFFSFPLASRSQSNPRRGSVSR